MSSTAFLQHPDTPVPIGVEYYRGPVPKPQVWDEDFARIRQAGLRIVRSFSFWNWMEPAPGQYQLDDFDRFFDLAHKRDLYVWLDITLATHGACPQWLLRAHPDIRAVDYRGQVRLADASPAMPQGSMVHCYDHPVWRQYGGALLRHVIGRYKDRPNLLVWGLWDGVGPAGTGEGGKGLPCYCVHSLAKYKAWLQQRFDLDGLNAYVQRRFSCWDDVAPPRNNNAVVEMRLFRRFQRANLVDQLRWMVGEARRIDPRHELRAHAAGTPRPWDEACARQVDSWGMSMPSNNLLTGPDPGSIADRAFSFDLSRSLGVGKRWWNEEIYAGMSRGGVTWKKQSLPQELTTLLWMSLAGGAAGVMFWQYRPEYLSFEAPGYNLTALDGRPTARFEAVEKAVGQLAGMKAHWPLVCPPAEVAVVYHPESQELFDFNDETERFNADLRGVYRTLWLDGVPVDVVTPAMDWSGYKLLFLPNVALMDDEVLGRIKGTLEESPETRLVAEGSFGLYSEEGQSSYAPPEGLGDRLGVRVADFSAVTQWDIEGGANRLDTPYGTVRLTSPCGYAVLQPAGDSQIVAHLEGEPVAVETGDGRFIWYGLSLSAGFGDCGVRDVVLGLVDEAGIDRPITVDQEQVVPVVRASQQGGQVLFLFHLTLEERRVLVHPNFAFTQVRHLQEGRDVGVRDGAFAVELGAGETAVLHLA